MSMNVGQLIEKLQEIAEKHGKETKIVGGYLSDDGGLSSVTLLNNKDDEYEGKDDEEIDGIYFE